jgi:hypothetical protein
MQWRWEAAHGLLVLQRVEDDRGPTGATRNMVPCRASVRKEEELHKGSQIKFVNKHKLDSKT